jgi:hypothetical protein
VPTINEGRFDAFLTTFAINYRQSADQYIADKVFTRVPVEFPSGLYNKFKRGAFLRDDMGPRPMGGYPRQVDYKLDKGSYRAEEDALETTLDDRERQAAGARFGYSPEKGKIRLLTSQYLIHRDRQWAERFFKAGVWSRDVTGDATPTGATETLFLSDASADPIGLVLLEKDRIAQLNGYDPNTIVMGRRVYRTLKTHPDVKAYLASTERKTVDRNVLAQAFEVERVLVPGATWNSAPEDVNDTETYEFIVGEDDMLLVYTNTTENPTMDDPTGGAIFYWRGLLGDQGFPMPDNEIGVWRGRDGRAYSDWFHVRYAADPQIVAADLGTFFSQIIEPA